MKNVVQIILMAILASCLFSCNSYQRKVKKIVEEWTGKEVVFPPLKAKMMGRDTVLPNILNHKFKILTYVDTVGCTSCRLKLFDWRILKKELDTLSEKVPLLFVIQSENYQEFEEIQRVNKFICPVFYDYHGDLNKINHFPDDPNFQTFLLDEDNKVIVIGNSVTNEQMHKIYWDVITHKRPAE